MQRTVHVSDKLVNMSCFTSCRATKDLKSCEIKQFQENFKIAQDYNLVPSYPPKTNNFVNTSTKLLKRI